MLLIIISWNIPLFKSSIDLHKDGSLLITEEITVNFSDGYFHGIYRDIPLELKGITGNYSLGFNILDVLCDGEKVPVERSKIRPMGWTHLRLRIGDPDRLITGRHIYLIKYSVLLGARYFKNHDELYWNITGNQWETEIDSVDFAVFFPSKITLNREDIRLFKGLWGSKTTDTTFILTEKSLNGWARDISPGEGVTIAIKFPKGYLKKPSGAKIFFLVLRNNLPFFLPLLIFILLFVHWWKNGRDVSPGPVQAIYEPPEGLPAPEAGVILDQRVDMVDIISILFELAKMGYLTIKEIETKKLHFLTKKDYEITITKSDTSELPLYMKKFLNALLTCCGEKFLVSELKENNFGENLSGIKDALYRVVTSKGYFTGNPELVRAKYLAGGIFFLFISIFLVGFSSFYLKLPISLVLSGIILIAFSPAMPKRTRKGTKKLREILGFREFLTRVEKPRLKALLEKSPTLFFDFLPYAIALGVAEHWAERFKGLKVERPDWYYAPNIGRSIFVASIAHSIGSSISSISSAMSTPRGGSSGFSGGGFSGGGGGGGGGGAW